MVTPYQSLVHWMEYDKQSQQLEQELQKIFL